MSLEQPLPKIGTNNTNNGVERHSPPFINNLTWNFKMGRTPGFQFQSGTLECDRLLDFNFSLNLWNGRYSNIPFLFYL
ncbi:unnamed protein product [Rhizophagus irregularis]|nr:unnamed protein product [Rhizophagus irregularis]